MSERAYTNWERAKTGIAWPNLRKTADVLGCSPDALLLEDNAGTAPQIDQIWELLDASLEDIKRRLARIEERLAQAQELSVGPPESEAALQAEFVEAFQRAEASLDAQAPAKARRRRRQ